MTSAIRKRIFIVGCARSGTTMLQALLAGHPEIASFPETHFFEKSLQDSGVFFSRGFRMYKTLYEWAGLNTDLNIPPESIKRHWRRKLMVDEFRKLMDQLTIDRGKSIWLEKTPGHIMHVDYIEKHFKEARFIHIIRDGRSVVASLYEVTRKYPEAWGGMRSLKQCISEWNERVYRSYKSRKRKNHFFLFYHNLTNNTEAELKKICDSIGISYYPDMIYEFKKNIDRVAKDDHPWMKQKSGYIADEGDRKFSSTFSNEEKLLIEKELLFPDIKKTEAMFKVTRKI